MIGDMNQNNLGDLENLANLKYRSSVLMLDKNGVFDVVFSDTDHRKVRELESRLKELEYETVVHSEVFRNGSWEPEIHVSADADFVEVKYPLLAE